MKYRGKYSLTENFAGRGFGLLKEITDPLDGSGNQGIDFENNVGKAHSKHLKQLGGPGQTDFVHIQSGVGVECKLSGNVALTNEGLDNASFKHFTFTKGSGYSYEFNTPDETSANQTFFEYAVNKMNREQLFWTENSALCDKMGKNSIKLLGAGRDRPPRDATDPDKGGVLETYNFGIRALDPQEAVTNLKNKKTDKGVNTAYVITGNGNPTDVAGAQVFRVDEEDPLNLGCPILSVPTVTYQMRWKPGDTTAPRYFQIQVNASGKVDQTGSTIAQLCAAEAPEAAQA